MITIEGNSRTVAILGSGEFNDSRGLSRDVRGGTCDFFNRIGP